MFEFLIPSPSSPLTCKQSRRMQRPVEVVSSPSKIITLRAVSVTLFSPQLRPAAMWLCKSWLLTACPDPARQPNYSRCSAFRPTTSSAPVTTFRSFKYWIIKILLHMLIITYNYECNFSRRVSLTTIVPVINSVRSSPCIYSFLRICTTHLNLEINLFTHNCDFIPEHS